MEKNRFNAEILLRKTVDGRINCECAGSLEDQKNLLGYYISEIAKALKVEDVGDVDDIGDDIIGIARLYFGKPDRESCGYVVIDESKPNESQSEKAETLTDCEHCKKEDSCFYKDIYPKGCEKFKPK